MTRQPSISSSLHRTFLLGSYLFAAVFGGGMHVHESLSHHHDGDEQHAHHFVLHAHNGLSLAVETPRTVSDDGNEHKHQVPTVSLWATTHSNISSSSIHSSNLPAPCLLVEFSGVEDALSFLNVISPQGSPPLIHTILSCASGLSPPTV